MTSGEGPGRRMAWLDLAAGVAGDMLLAALLDAGAPLAAVQAAVDAVVPGTVRLAPSAATRAGLRATALRVDLLAPAQPHRPWPVIRDLLVAAPLAEPVRARALAAFTLLAEAEARVHGVPVDDVHFHEVGGWDAIADVVGVSAAAGWLGVDEFVAGELALGSGQVRTAHGVLPVPVPAVLELCRGRPVTSGGDGELATPTGVALVAALAPRSGPLPPMTVEATGVGAGSRDRAGRANVVRVVLGRAGGGPDLEAMVLLETTVDDLDPRVWPAVVDDLLAAGAADAWVTPVLMKKGRPGHVLSALAAPGAAAALRRLVLDRTTTLGVRESVVRREVLDRAWLDVPLPGDGLGDGPGDGSRGPTVAVKIGHRDGRIVHVTPEFDDAARLAPRRDGGVRAVLDDAAAAAAAAGLVPGAPVPPGARPTR